LAQVNKAYNDAVWSVDGVRSMKAKMDTYNDLNPYRYPAFERIPHIHVAPIYWAVWHRNVPAVKALLKSGVDVNKHIPVNNGTPLYYAAYKGHMSIVTLLLDAGANLSSDDWGNTPISASIVKGHKNIVELLRAAEVNGWKRKRSS
jgi:ankyrin repeat protein